MTKVSKSNLQTNVSRRRKQSKLQNTGSPVDSRSSNRAPSKRQKQDKTREVQRGPVLKKKYRLPQRDGRTSFGTRGSAPFGPHEKYLKLSIKNIGNLSMHEMSNRQAIAAKKDLMEIIDLCHHHIRYYSPAEDASEEDASNALRIRKLLGDATRLLVILANSLTKRMTGKQLESEDASYLPVCTENRMLYLKEGLPFMLRDELLNRCRAGVREYGLTLDESAFNTKCGRLLDMLDDFNSLVLEIRPYEKDNSEILESLKRLAGRIKEASAKYRDLHNGDKTQEVTCQVMKEVATLAAWKVSVLVTYGKGCPPTQLPAPTEE